MPEWTTPALLLLLPLVPLLRWLHRRRDAEREVLVPAVFLWPLEGAEGGATRQTRRRDLRWLLRACIAALLVTAAAGPVLLRSGRATVDVYVDETPSLWAREPGGSRLELGERELSRALALANAGEVRVIPLRRPGALRVLERNAGGRWNAELARWTQPEPEAARLPAAAQLRPDAEHWLLSDGSDPAVIAWARSVPLQRVIWVGEASENVGVTGLSVRPELAQPERLRGIVRVSSGGSEQTTRRLRVTSGSRTLLDDLVEIPAGETAQLSFGLPAALGAPLRAELTPADALPEDDELILNAVTALRPRLGLDPRCGAHLTRALRAHPGVRLVSGANPDLSVWCSRSRPHGASPVLWFLPEDSSAEGGARPVRVQERAGPPRSLEVSVDMEDRTWAGRPEYATFLAGLLDRISGRRLLDWTASVGLPEAAVRIAPQPERTETVSLASQPSRGRLHLAVAVLALAAGLLALDAWWTRGALLSAVGRVAVLAAVGAAVWNPAPLWTREPLNLIALMDDSLSIDRSAVEEIWERMADAARNLPRQSRISVLRFAAEVKSELEAVPVGSRLGKERLSAALPRTGSLDRSETDLEQALAEALARVQVGRPARVVVVSDFVVTRGDTAASLRALDSAGVPVVAALAPVFASGRDGWIASLEAPAEARVGEVLPVRVGLGSRARVRARLRLRMGRAASDREVALEPGATPIQELKLPLRTPGLHLLEATLETPGDSRPENDTYQALVHVAGPPGVQYLTSLGEDPPLLRRLSESRWAVERVHPSEYARSDLSQPPPALIVLDDIAVDDMSAAGWRALEQRVRLDGTGLLVLGGGRSFAAGAYRDSLLEGLLPVTAETRDERSAAAILFLVDTSGSMERDRAGAHRLEVARQAVIETLRSVSGADLVGVSVFAVEPREILPLARYSDAADRLSGRFPAASGGTRLGPAIAQAVARLSQASVDQRLLVLVTDGFVQGEDLRDAEQALREAEVQVIALAVGVDVDLAVLERLTARGGALLRVNEEANLPRLMRSEVGERIEPARLGLFRPQPVAPLPFPFESVQWPELSGYMVSRARPDAQVYLTAKGGDPLFAAHHAGTGRVAVLPAGLAGWAQSWLAWSEWGSFAGGLLQWLARPATNPRIYAHFTDGPHGLAFEIDGLAVDGEWSTDPSAQVLVVDPAGHAQSHEVAARAPGHYEGTLAAGLPGVYRVAIRVGDQVRVGGALRSAERELGARIDAAETLATWQEAGWLELWPGSKLSQALRAPLRPTPLRSPLVLVALAVYLVLLVREEVLVPRVRP